MQSTPAVLKLRMGMINELRKTYELQSDEALAEAMGVHRSSVSRVFRGKAEPSTRFLGSLCTALQAPPAALFVVVGLDEHQQVAA